MHRRQSNRDRMVAFMVVPSDTSFLPVRKHTDFSKFFCHWFSCLLVPWPLTTYHRQGRSLKHVNPQYLGCSPLVLFCPFFPATTFIGAEYAGEARDVPPPRGSAAVLAAIGTAPDHLAQLPPGYLRALGADDAAFPRLPLPLRRQIWEADPLRWKIPGGRPPCRPALILRVEWHTFAP